MGTRLGQTLDVVGVIFFDYQHLWSTLHEDGGDRGKKASPMARAQRSPCRGHVTTKGTIFDISTDQIRN